MDRPFDEALVDGLPLGESASSSASGILYLPPTYLDALIPGYSVLAQALLDYVGVDISFYVSLCALLFILQAAWNYTVAPFTEFVLKFITSHVYIDEYDDIYDQLLKWVRAHRLMADLRALKAESQGRYYDYDDDDDQEMATSLAAGSIFNFNDWAARATPRYEPHYSSGFFYHKGYFYRIIRDKEQVKDDWGPVREREKLIVTVLWRSTRPIKALIEESREFYLGSRTCRTRIYRPVAREERSSNNEWHVVAVRPSRPVSTVVLDDAPKAQILLDLNEFLAPQTAKWYSSRGIPYRRGYLFHGPPGTGKSSMSFSLAGLFGLNIYCLSLSEITLTEESLIVLFNTLPKRCIVLLEDIDSAGVSRPKPPSNDDDDSKKSKRKNKNKKNNKRSKQRKKEESTDSSSSSGDDDDDAIPLRPGGAQQKKLTNAISISGLLNAIDGVASQEGRVLIMTTNHPERLDHALVRPGRVDMQIKFDLASRMQIRELFLRMYSADAVGGGRQPTRVQEVMPHMDLEALVERDIEEEAGEGVVAAAAAKVVSSGSLDGEKVGGGGGGGGGAGPVVSQAAAMEKVTETGKAFDARLEALADRFAAELPGDTFSPAEVQGYLLMRKNKPRRAVMEVGVWKEEVLAKRLAGKDEKEEKGAKSRGRVGEVAVDGGKRVEGGEVDGVVVSGVNGIADKPLINGSREVDGQEGNATEKARKKKKVVKAVRESDDSSSGSDPGSGSDGSRSDSD